MAAEKGMISITLPSLYPDKLERALANLRETTRGVYEVIVVSPFEPEYSDEIVWIEDLPRLGPNAAHERALRMTSGDFILSWVDDHLLAPAWDDAAVAELHALAIINPDAVLGLRHADTKHVGTVFGRYYPFFPFMRNYTARRSWFDGAYRRGFADCDLGLRVWARYGFCAWSGPLVTRCGDDVKRLTDSEAGYEPQDLELFLRRWGQSLGQGWPTNVVRDFNIDVIPEELRCVRDGTINVKGPLELWS